MTAAILAFLASSAFIIVAGHFLTKYADAIAELTGFGRLLVGSILLAGATSLPELSVDINAILLDQPNLAIGDLLGSCLCNLLILAVLDMSHLSRGRMFSPRSAAHALSAMMTVVLASIVALGILIQPGPSVSRLGVVSFVILAAYIAGYRLVFQDQRVAARPEGNANEPAPPASGHPGISLTRAALGFAGAAVVILIAAPHLARAADELAELSGLGRSFVGTTLVAFSTSLPELVASLAALRMGSYDLALGNIFGSNAFNLAMVAVLDFFMPGPILNAIAQVNAITAVSVVLVTAVAVAGQIYRVESRLKFIEPDAFLVVVLVLSAMGLVYAYG